MTLNTLLCVLVELRSSGSRVRGPYSLKHPYRCHTEVMRLAVQAHKVAGLFTGNFLFLFKVKGVFGAVRHKQAVVLESTDGLQARSWLKRGKEDSFEFQAKRILLSFNI